MANLTVDEPPALPADTASQMSSGSNPFSGIGAMIGGPKPGGAPQADAGGGALKAQVDAIKKVLEKIIQSSKSGKTFFSRASQMLDQGLAVESQQGPGTPPKTQGSDSGSPDSMAMSKPPADSFAG